MYYVKCINIDVVFNKSVIDPLINHYQQDIYIIAYYLQKEYFRYFNVV